MDADLVGSALENFAVGVYAGAILIIVLSIVVLA